MSAPLALLLLPLALASETSMVLEGELPDDGLDHAFLPFDVPEGVVEIEVRHDDLSDANVLDWGLDDPAGFRGWGGGNSEAAVVGVDAASRSYVPGPIPSGTWNVVVGKASVVEPPARYRVEVVLRTTPTLAPQPERAPYAEPAALETGARWYAGDLHVHSEQSGDASPTLDEVATFAKGVGLDFVVLTEHNTNAHLTLFADAQARHPDLLLVPGVEFTTYDGHANGIGATDWVDHRMGQPGVDIAAAAAAFAAQGAVFSVNHPTIDLGDLCIGCAWAQDLDPAAIGAVEIVTGGWEPVGQLFAPAAMALWESWLDAGHRVAPVGGSDDHDAGTDDGPMASPIGNPTTLVWAESLSTAALLDGIRAGRTVVKLQGPDDPMVEVWPDPMPAAGDDPTDAATFVVTVTGGLGDTLRVVQDGRTLAEVDVDADPFTWSTTVDAPPEGTRLRAEVEVDGDPRTVTGHWWVKDADGVAEPLPYQEECACGTGGLPSAAVALGMAAALAGGRRRRADGRWPMADG